MNKQTLSSEGCFAQPGAQTLAIWKSKIYYKSSISGLSGRNTGAKFHMFRGESNFNRSYIYLSFLSPEGNLQKLDET